MSTIVYDGTLHEEIWTKEALISQLDRALSILRNGNESDLIRVEIAQIMVEIDRKEHTIVVIA